MGLRVIQIHRANAQTGLSVYLALTLPGAAKPVQLNALAEQISGQ